MQSALELLKTLHCYDAAMADGLDDDRLAEDLEKIREYMAMVDRSELPARLRALTDEQRGDLFAGFCRGCFRPYTWAGDVCHCQNDE